jgi:hypothetical protein
MQHRTTLFGVSWFMVLLVGLSNGDTLQQAVANFCAQNGMVYVTLATTTTTTTTTATTTTVG